MKSYGQEMSQYHEQRLAKKLGGRAVPGSGASWSRKGDVVSDDLLIEHKWTGKDRYTVKADILDKIYTEALLAGRTPVFMMDVGGTSWMFMEESDFLEMREKARKWDASN